MEMSLCSPLGHLKALCERNGKREGPTHVKLRERRVV